VDLSDTPIYALIENCFLRGVLPPVSAVKPYRYRDLRQLLNRVVESPGRLSATELSLLQRILDNLSPLCVIRRITRPPPRSLAPQRTVFLACSNRMNFREMRLSRELLYTAADGLEKSPRGTAAPEGPLDRAPSFRQAFLRRGVPQARGFYGRRTGIPRERSRRAT